MAKARRSVEQSLSLGHATEEKQDPKALGEQLRQVMLRVNRLEASAPKEATEFEVVVSSLGATVELMHNYGGPVRWWVTGWMRISASIVPSSGPSLVESATSTNDLLVLSSYVAGRAIIRVEPSSSFVEA